jgi:hypothetical protein
MAIDASASTGLHQTTIQSNPTIQMGTLDDAGKLLVARSGVLRKAGRGKNSDVRVKRRNFFRKFPNDEN